MQTFTYKKPGLKIYHTVKFMDLRWTKVYIYTRGLVEQQSRN